MPAPARPSVVVFDFGGVLINWDPRHLYRRLFDDPDEMEAFLEEVDLAEWNARQDAGGSWAEAIEQLAAQHPERRELIEAFQRVLAQVPEGSFHDVIAERISVADRINDILGMFQGKESLVFEELFGEFLTREYVIATFLAILELCKLRMVRVTQVHGFGTIWIMPAVSQDTEKGAGEGDSGASQSEIDH